MLRSLLLLFVFVALLQANSTPTQSAKATFNPASSGDVASNVLPNGVFGPPIPPSPSPSNHPTHFKQPNIPPFLGVFPSNSAKPAKENGGNVDLHFVNQFAVYANKNSATRNTLSFAAATFVVFVAFV